MSLQNIQFNNNNLDFDQDVTNEQKSSQRPLSQVHIRIVQRGKKCLTFIEGLADDLDLNKIAKYIRKQFDTGSAVVFNKKTEAYYIQISGDHREAAKAFLIKYKIWEEPDPPIQMHGAV